MVCQSLGVAQWNPNQLGTLTRLSDSGITPPRDGTYIQRVPNAAPCRGEPGVALGNFGTSRAGRKPYPKGITTKCTLAVPVQSASGALHDRHKAPYFKILVIVLRGHMPPSLPPQQPLCSRASIRAAGTPHAAFPSKCDVPHWSMRSPDESPTRPTRGPELQTPDQRRSGKSSLKHRLYKTDNNQPPW